jgi:hypothetical protein
MAAHVLTVDPHIADIVHCAKVQQDPLALHFLWQSKGSAVPYGLMKSFVTNAGKGRFAGIGHGYFFVKGALPNGKIPLAV